MTTPQVEAALGLSEQSVRGYLAAGRLPARRHGIRGLFTFREEDLRTYAVTYRYVIDEGVLDVVSLFIDEIANHGIAAGRGLLAYAYGAVGVMSTVQPPIDTADLGGVSVLSTEHDWTDRRL